MRLSACACSSGPRLFGLGARDLHCTGATCTVFFDIRGKLRRRAADDFVAFVDELLLPEFRFLQQLPGILIYAHDYLLGSASREKQPDPRMRLHFGKAKFRERWTLRKQRRALRPADGQRLDAAGLEWSHGSRDAG